MKTIKPKIFEVFKSYSKKQLISDVVAGIIVAIIALPLSIALAIASGVSPERGLYTAIVAGFVISFLGGSRVNISGPTAAFATTVAGIVALHGIEGLAVATLMAGIILVVMGLLRLGTLIKYIPERPIKNSIATPTANAVRIMVLSRASIFSRDATILTAESESSDLDITVVTAIMFSPSITPR